MPPLATGIRVLLHLFTSTFRVADLAVGIQNRSGRSRIGAARRSRWVRLVHSLRSNYLARMAAFKIAINRAVGLCTVIPMESHNCPYPDANKRIDSYTFWKHSRLTSSLIANALRNSAVESKQVVMRALHRKLRNKGFRSDTANRNRHSTP